MPVTTPPGKARASTQLPDALGRYGAFGGRFVPETLMGALDRLAEAYAEAQADPTFQATLDALAPLTGDVTEGVTSDQKKGVIDDFQAAAA